jgi:hypothetical protein
VPASEIFVEDTDEYEFERENNEPGLASAPAAEASSGHNEPTHADARPGVTEPEPSLRNKRLQLVSAPAVASALGDRGPRGAWWWLIAVAAG